MRPTVLSQGEARRGKARLGECIAVLRAGRNAAERASERDGEEKHRREGENERERRNP